MDWIHLTQGKIQDVVLCMRHRNYAFYKKENQVTRLAITDFSKKWFSQFDE
jgi:hypothetical protein